MMESEWRDHVEHDESHKKKKWGCTAIGSLTKCGQQEGECNRCGSLWDQDQHNNNIFGGPLRYHLSCFVSDISNCTLHDMHDIL